MNKYIAEFLGTFMLIFCGTGAMTINEVLGGAVGHVGIGITWGFSVVAVIYAFGEISGAHLNPAVSIAFAWAKKFSWKEVPFYIIAQFFGALLASGILYFLFPQSKLLGGTHVNEILTPLQGFVMEFILTFMLMMVIIHVATGSKEVGIMAGMAIGGVVMLEALFAGPVTNASMNPIRSLVPAIVSNNYQDLWLYLIAPVLGAILAVTTCKLIKKDSCCTTC